MMQKLILFLLLYNLSIIPEEPAKTTLKIIHENVVATHSGLEIAAAAIDLGFLLCAYVSPSQQQQLKEQNIQRQKNILLAEQKLKECIVAHAFTERLPEQFPKACMSIDDFFVQIAGINKRNALREEFNKAITQLPVPTNKSTQQAEVQESSGVKKYIIGGVVVIVVGGVIFFLTPFILPGTAIAAKATAATASIKSAAVATGAKIAQTTTAVKVSAFSAAEGARQTFESLSTTDKVNSVAQAVRIAQTTTTGAVYLGSFVVETSEQELKRLLSENDSRPIKERIKEAHFAH